jgi:NAD(P)-dependent dehydrogenase (short-subunit alcohol dehydrogenase family)
MTLNNKKIVVIGGSSGMGLAIATQAVGAGASVVIAGRSQKRLESAQAASGAARALVLDMTEEREVERFFSEIGSFDHLVITASEATFGLFLELPIQRAKSFFESKFWGPYTVARYGAPLIREGGTITFFSGAASQRPEPAFTAGSTINAAIEHFAGALARELAPRVRVNCISPGLIATPVWESVVPDASERSALLERLAEKLPMKRIGHADEIAHAALFLMQNTYATGTVLFVDGGFSRA